MVVTVEIVKDTIDFTNKATGNVITGTVEYPKFTDADQIVEWLKGEDLAEKIGADGKVVSVESQLNERKKVFTDRTNRGYNLAARADMRQELMLQVQGPEKSFAALVAAVKKDRAAKGKPVSDEKAIAIAKRIQELELEEENEPSNTPQDTATTTA